MFNDRFDAGNKLARALGTFSSLNPLVLAIPRGGVEIAVPVIEEFHWDYSLLVSRKLPFPDNPESGFGAIAEDGSLYFHEEARNWLPESQVQSVIEDQRKIIEERIRILRNGKPLPGMAGRTVILMDDGLAMGSTMMAAILLCKKQHPESVVVAVPVAGEAVAKKTGGVADKLVVLEIPPLFQAVAQVYRHWKDLSDEDVLAALNRLQDTLK